MKNSTGLLLIKDSCAIRNDNYITTFQHMGPSYLVRFELYPTQFEVGWHNILHFSIGDNSGQMGDRMPAVWSDYWYNRLNLCSGVNDDFQYGHCKDDSETVIPLKEWSFVEFAQQKFGSDYVYTLNLNGREIHRIVNKKARHFKNMHLYMADPWGPPQKGYIRNLYVEGYEGYE